MGGGFHSPKQEMPEKGHAGGGGGGREETMRSVWGLGYLWDTQAELPGGIWIYKSGALG